MLVLGISVVGSSPAAPVSFPFEFPIPFYSSLLPPRGSYEFYFEFLIRPFFAGIAITIPLIYCLFLAGLLRFGMKWGGYGDFWLRPFLLFPPQAFSVRMFYYIRRVYYRRQGHLIPYIIYFPFLLLATLPHVVYQSDFLSFTFQLLNVVATTALIGNLATSYVRKRPLFLAVSFLAHFLLSAAFFTDSMLLFFIFFELLTFLLAFQISNWTNKPRSGYAAHHMLWYGIAGGLLFLLGLAIFASHSGTVYFAPNSVSQLPVHLQHLVFALISVGFLVKIPVVPFHDWLLQAHVESPTAVSMYLAGAVLKIGYYGLLKFSLPLFPDSALFFRPFVLCLTTLSCLYLSFSMINQTDPKRLVAYSSVVHMSFAAAALFSGDFYGLWGSLLGNFSHTLYSMGLFLIIGHFQSQRPRRAIEETGAIVNFHSKLSTFLLFFSLVAASFPGTVQFSAELLMAFGLGTLGFPVLFLHLSSSLFAGIYLFWLFTRILFGPSPIKYMEPSACDLSPCDTAVCCYLAFGAVALGFFPRLLPFPL